MLAIHQELTIDQRLTKAYIDIMNHLRYMALGPLLLHGKRTIVDDPSVTARTNGRDIEYGRQFIESLDDYELRFLILHEVYHKLFRHLTDAGRDHAAGVANITAELERGVSHDLACHSGRKVTQHLLHLLEPIDTDKPVHICLHIVRAAVTATALAAITSAAAWSRTSLVPSRRAP